MAHTSNGKLRGRAAVTQRVEDREQIIGQTVDLNAIRARLKQKENEAITRCVALEGKKPFYTWYASVDGSISGRVELIEERIRGLEAEERYTIVDSLLGKEGASVFQTMDAAEALKGS